MTHTPGPWIARNVDGTGVHAGGFTIETADRMLICRRNGRPGRVAESQANARLIAAAPDLLAVVKAAVVVLTAPGAPTDALARELLAATRALVAAVEAP